MSGLHNPRLDGFGELSDADDSGCTWKKYWTVNQTALFRTDLGL